MIFLTETTLKKTSINDFTDYNYMLIRTICCSVCIYLCVYMYCKRAEIISINDSKQSF